MARLRNRILKADYWVDGELLRWPREKRWTYAGMYSIAEDSGVIENDPFTWKVMIWSSPLDADVTVEKLEQWRDELIAAGKLIEFAVGDEELLFLRSFHEHERPRNPQSPNLPLPPWVTWTPGDRAKKTRNSYTIDAKLLERAIGKKPGKALAVVGEKAPAQQNGKDDGSFDIFWAFYPRHENRKGAATAWKYLTKAQRELAIGVAQVMGALYENGQKEKKYIPMPTTFIHKERWEDWREGVPAGWQDSSAERAAQQQSTIDAAIAAAYKEES